MQPPEDALNTTAKSTDEELSAPAEPAAVDEQPKNNQAYDEDKTYTSDTLVRAPTHPPEPTADNSTRMIGTTLNGHFELLSLIGEGGMSFVYKGRDVLLNKIVAVKVLRPNLLHQPNIARRLQVEALATSSLSHPNTIGIRHFDVTSDGLPYLVMVYAEGRSIGEIVSTEGAFEPQRAVKLVRQIADALAHAHSKGIIHRDLKATNVLVSELDGKPDFVKVVDFGIAKILNPDGVDVATQLTATGEVFGSPIAMSPEQCKGAKVDERSDVYALGCLMYQMLTGRSVFTTKNNFELLFKQLNDTPDSFKIASPQAKIPPQLEAITFKAMQKDSNARYQSMHELIADLDRLGTQTAISGRLRLAAQKLRANRRLTVYAVAAALILLAATAYATMQGVATESLLSSVIPWQRPAPLLPVLKETEQTTTKNPQLQQALNQMKDCELAFASLQKNGAHNGSRESELRSQILKMKECGDALAKVGAYRELESMNVLVCGAGAEYFNMVKPTDDIANVRAVTSAIKTFGDRLYDSGFFGLAELVYRTAQGVAQRYSGSDSADDQYFSKLVADSSFKQAEFGQLSEAGYDRTRNCYDRFFPTKDDPKLVVRDQYFVDEDGKFIAKTNDLAGSPLAWDAHRKRAECQYNTHQYEQAAEDYQWIFLHQQPKAMVSDQEMALLHWHAADCLRMIALRQTNGPSKDANDALKEYKFGELLNERLQRPNAKNAALSHAYMVALSEHFDRLSETLPNGVTAQSTLLEMQKQFGDTDRATMLFEIEYASYLCKNNGWADALPLWAHVAYVRAANSGH